MKVTILGNNSALPAFARHPTSQVVSVYGDLLMIDCGEGAQIQMQRYGLKWRRLQHIFISHMHGDHYFGLPGLINSMSLLGRTLPLHLYGPASLEGILKEILSVADTVLAYPFHFYPLPEGDAVLVDNESFKVSCFPVSHRIPCHGFLIERKTRGRKILPEKCTEYEIPAYYYDKLKEGADYERKDGFVVKNEWVTTDGPMPKKYAYCADTIFTDSFIQHIQGADTIYHECTYLEADAAKAEARFHSTAIQAARIALMANAKQLLLGHFSSKYKDLEPFRDEAATIFPNVHATMEGAAYEI
ncbi:MAG: ribonuclease Z [Sphingobacteriales bacterium]|nr:MAG: ribonuclease Z [Sphingobacteriales bacterium]